MTIYGLLLILITLYLTKETGGIKIKDVCYQASFCSHKGKRRCGLEAHSKEIRWFLNSCDVLEFNCEYKRIFIMCCLAAVTCHGPPLDRDNEDIAMGRKVQKMGAKWCSMAKVCNHDRVPVCGISHAGDIIGFRDLCDMFDYNCIRRRNYKQTTCPGDKSLLTVSRRPTNSYYDE